MVLQVCAELHDDGSVLSDEDRESWKENVSCTPNYYVLMYGCLHWTYIHGVLLQRLFLIFGFYICIATCYWEEALKFRSLFMSRIIAYIGVRKVHFNNGIHVLFEISVYTKVIVTIVLVLVVAGGGDDDDDDDDGGDSGDGDGDGDCDGDCDGEGDGGGGCVGGGSASGSDDVIVFWYTDNTCFLCQQDITNCNVPQSLILCQCQCYTCISI